MSKQKTEVYVCSKPLQYFNVRNIVSDLESPKKILVFLGFFVDSEAFYSYVRKYDRTWDEVLYFKNFFLWDLYLFFHPVDTLYVECDASMIYGLFYKMSRFKNMYMFEEGFGSYRRDRFDQSKGLKKWINDYTGVGKHIGFSSFLKGQYLYMPELYKLQFPKYDKLIRNFSRPFIEKLREDLPLYLRFSTGYEEFLSLKRKKVAIYLTNHKLNISIVELLDKEKNNFDCVYVKLHPHLRSLDMREFDGIKVLHTNIMVEFLLLLLLDGENKLTVYHENSTSVIWFQNLIDSRNLGKPYEEYNIVTTYIKNRGLLS